MVAKVLWSKYGRFLVMCDDWLMLHKKCKIHVTTVDADLYFCWLYYCIYTVSQKNVPPLNCLQLCQNLIDFQNFFTAGKPIKFAIKVIWQYPPYLRHVATLPWEIKHSNFLQIFSRYGRKCKQIAF